MGNGGTAVITVQRPHENRWSARKKADADARLLRGESLDELSREVRVEAAVAGGDLVGGRTQAASAARLPCVTATTGGIEAGGHAGTEGDGGVTMAGAALSVFQLALGQPHVIC
jgi:hypothetical protein